MSIYTKLILAIVLAGLLCPASYADEVLYSVLPPSYSSLLNTLDGSAYLPLPSNAAFNAYQSRPEIDGGDGTYPDYVAGAIFGGEFMLGVGAVIHELTIWAPGYIDVETQFADTTQGYTAPDFEWAGDELGLYMGPDSGAATLVSNSYRMPTPVFYAETGGPAGYSETNVGVSDVSGENYRNSHATTVVWNQLWQITFTGLSFVVDPDTEYMFGVATKNDATGTHLFQLHATLCPGANWDNCQSSGIMAMVPIAGPEGSAYNAEGYRLDTLATNPYNVDVQIYGTPVPEPTTLLLIGAGLGLFGLARRRR